MLISSSAEFDGCFVFLFYEACVETHRTMVSLLYSLTHSHTHTFCVCVCVPWWIWIMCWWQQLRPMCCSANNFRAESVTLFSSSFWCLGELRQLWHQCGEHPTVDLWIGLSAGWPVMWWCSVMLLTLSVIEMFGLSCHMLSSPTGSRGTSGFIFNSWSI